MSVLITVISFILVLGVLVFFHELGHYLAARRSGIEVEEFGMGYPPRAAKLFTYKGTVFTLNWLPFGGFARMKGEDAGDMSPGSFNAASAGGRAFTLLAGPLMNLVLAMILFAVSFMVGGSEVLLAHPLVVQSPSPIVSTLGLEPGDVLLEAGGVPAHVNAIPDDALAHTWQAPGSGPVELLVLRGGAPTLLPAVDQAGVRSFLNNPADYVAVMSTRIEGTAPESPADVAGLQPNDLVYTVDGTVVTLETPLADLVQQNLEQEMTLTVLREAALVNASMVPRAEPPAGEGALGVQIGPVSEFASLPFLQSVWRGITDTFRYIWLVLELPVRLILGTAAPGAAQVSGPVGIAREVGGAVSSSIDYGVFWPILRLSAVLSAALAITNLLPLPALDGGRLLFIVIEKLRGRRVSPEREGMVHVVGFMLLLSLMVLITVRDIAAPHQTIDWSLILGQ
jgi:regulator of sigma E protease